MSYKKRNRQIEEIVRQAFEEGIADYNEVKALVEEELGSLSRRERGLLQGILYQLRRERTLQEAENNSIRGTFTFKYDGNLLVVTFRSDVIPPAEFRTALKQMGFRWDRWEKEWRAYANDIAKKRPEWPNKDGIEYVIVVDDAGDAEEAQQIAASIAEKLGWDTMNYRVAMK